MDGAFSLLVLACSATKRPDPHPLRALDRYDGVMWRTLRTALAELPAASHPHIRVWFLSAHYGFHPAEMLIVDYEEAMTPRRADELLRIPTSNHAAFAAEACMARNILLAGGFLYRETMRRAIKHRAEITETDGAGIGIHRQQLRQWLTRQQHPETQPLNSETNDGYEQG